MFYSHLDRQNFVRTMVSDGTICRQVMMERAARGESLTEDEKISCLGLESVLSPTVLHHSALRKRNHRRAVLEVQEHQLRLGVYDAGEVARVSSITSRTSKVYSHKIAISMMGIADEQCV
jgi:hypothetical protein